jgi:urease accessory protein
LALSLSLLPLAAQAHVDGSGAHSHEALTAFVQGLQHPFTGLDHLAALLALGLWMAAARSIRLAPMLGFVLAMMGGALMSRVGVALPAIEPMIATSVFVIGLIAASQTRLSRPLSAGIAAAFGLFHGAAHGLEMSGPLAGVSLMGVVLGSVLIGCMASLVSRWDRSSQGWVPRCAGVFIALFGIGLL